MWIGISPETIISGNKEKGYYSQALAEVNLKQTLQNGQKRK